MVMIISGKRMLEGINNQKTLFQTLCDFAPIRRRVIAEAMACYLDIIRGFWFMFYMTLLAPLYPFYYVCAVILTFIYDTVVSTYYYLFPKKPVFRLDGLESVVIEDETSHSLPNDSRDEFPIGYTGPRVGTIQY